MGKTRDLFKKIGDNRGTFHAKIGTRKDRNSKEVAETKEINKKQQENAELQKNDLNNLENHDGEVTHLEPDILGYIVKWALGSITMSKAGGGDQIPTELFQILKMMLLKGCTQYTNKFGKLSSGYRTGKDQFSFKSQRKTMPKNVQATGQLHSFHLLARSCSKFSKPGFIST